MGWVILSMLAALVWAGGAQETVLVGGELALYPGSKAAVAVTVDILEGWYIQESKPALEQLVATVIRMEPAEGLVWEPVRYPKPEKKYFAFARRELGVYSGTVTFVVPVTVAPDAAPGLRLVKALVQYQSCSDRYCLAPELAEVTIPVRVLPPESVDQRSQIHVAPWGWLGGAFFLWATVRLSSSKSRRFHTKPGP